MLTLQKFHLESLPHLKVPRFPLWTYQHFVHKKRESKRISKQLWCHPTCDRMWTWTEALGREKATTFLLFDVLPGKSLLPLPRASHRSIDRQGMLMSTVIHSDLKVLQCGLGNGEFLDPWYSKQIWYFNSQCISWFKKVGKHTVAWISVILHTWHSSHMKFHYMLNITHIYVISFYAYVDLLKLIPLAECLLSFFFSTW